MPIARSATKEDLREVATWITSSREAELWAGPRVTFPIDVHALPTQIEFTQENALCMVNGDRLLAFGQLVAKGSGRGHLARIIVSPRARRRGYGVTLVRALLELAAERRYARISLNVDAANPGALALYSKLGFEETTPPADEPRLAGTRYMERRSA